MKIKQNILEILEKCSTDKDLKIVYLPNLKLDRKTYLDVNKCLESIGGQWNRKQKGHIFEDNPVDLFDNLLMTGETEDIRKEFQFFETPKKLVLRMIEMAELKKSDLVLEPSAGQGAIADNIKIGRLYINELNKKNHTKLLEKEYKNISNDDFLETHYDTFNKIIMNPPFSKQQDIDHILKAFECLGHGGILVSIISEGPFFRTNKKSVEFRKFLKSNNTEIIKNPEGTFKSSGTMVNTRIIKIIKRR